jgi:hypothetical protein
MNGPFLDDGAGAGPEIGLCIIHCSPTVVVDAKVAGSQIPKGVRRAVRRQVVEGFSRKVAFASVAAVVSRGHLENARSVCSRQKRRGVIWAEVIVGVGNLNRRADGYQLPELPSELKFSRMTSPFWGSTEPLDARNTCPITRMAPLLESTDGLQVLVGACSKYCPLGVCTLVPRTEGVPKFQPSVEVRKKAVQFPPAANLIGHEITA